MLKVDDGEYWFEGTRYRVRHFENIYIPLPERLPIFVAEEGVRNETSLAMNRVEIVKYWSGTLDTTPDQIVWLELSPDRSMKQFDFRNSHSDTVPDGDNPLEIRLASRYTFREYEVSREEVEYDLGEVLTHYEAQEHEELKRMQTQMSDAIQHEPNF